MDNYQPLSIQLTQTISPSQQKNEGIFFTPNSTIQRILTIISEDLPHIKTILEPSCGSCQFISQLDTLDHPYNITGVEANNVIFKHIAPLEFQHNVVLYYSDFLRWHPNRKFDLVIGNPPYFVIKKDSVPVKYHPFLDGRPNIFTIFILKAICHLNPNGILAFVLPSNFTNCLYYDKVRQYIHKTCQIIDIIHCDVDKYLTTKQDTIILIIRKKSPQTQTKSQYKSQTNSPYSILISNYLILNSANFIETIRQLYQNANNLHQLGFKVTVGTVVWNQCKKILTNDSTHTRLIYSSDIINNQLDMIIYKNENKKNYIQKEGCHDLLLVINRGYGKGAYTFKYCLIDVPYPYLIENHLICVRPVKPIPVKILRHKYHQIIKSLEDDRTKQFVKIYFGNNAINTTELTHILPIF